jgi:putative ABC transport system permease protein
MNVMLASVLHRTREIGLRLTVGAPPWTIRLQFIAEAMLLSLAGGVLGALIGVGGILVVHAALGWPVHVPVTSMALAFAFSATAGVLFGSYPAHVAAGLDPMAALHHD